MLNRDAGPARFRNGAQQRLERRSVRVLGFLIDRRFAKRKQIAIENAFL